MPSSNGILRARLCDPPPCQKYYVAKINNIIHWHSELVAGGGAHIRARINPCVNVLYRSFVFSVSTTYHSHRAGGIRAREIRIFARHCLFNQCVFFGRKEGGSENSRANKSAWYCSFYLRGIDPIALPDYYYFRRGVGSHVHARIIPCANVWRHQPYYFFFSPGEGVAIFLGGKFRVSFI